MINKSSKIIMVITGIVMVISAVILVILLSRNIHGGNYPMWEKAVEIEESKDVNLQFVGINLDVDPENQREDLVTISIANIGEKDLGYGEGYSVEYFSKGEWYTIYQPETVKSIGIILKAKETHEGQYVVPRNLFQKPGQYRILVDSLGYCIISAEEKKQNS